MQKLILLVVVLFTFLAVESRAQDVSPVMSGDQVVDLIASVYNTPAHRFLLKSLDGPDGRGFRVVYVHNGKRYTLDHDWWVDGIQIWVRPDGTSHPNPPADAFADEDMDGVVDFGTDGDVRIFAVANHYHDGSAAMGMEHSPYWQNICNEALIGLRAAVG